MPRFYKPKQKPTAVDRGSLLKGSLEKYEEKNMKMSMASALTILSKQYGDIALM
jgi:hypothetical protein